MFNGLKRIYNRWTTIPVVPKRKSWVMEKEQAWWAFGLPFPTYYGTRVVEPFKQVSTVFNAVTKISKNIAKVELEFYEENAKEGANPVSKHEILDVFRANPELTQTQLIEGTMQHLELHGDAFWYRVNDVTRKKIKYIDLLIPSHMSFKSEGREIFWFYDMEQIDGVHHFKYINPYHPIHGMSAALPCQLEYETDFLAAKWNKRFFENNGLPTGLIVAPPGVPVNIETKEQIKNEFLQMLGGGQTGARGIGVIGGGAEWRDLSTTQHDAEFLAGRKFSREQILAAWDVPPAVAGIFEYANYSNSKEQIKYFWFNNLIPKIAYLQDKINQFLAINKAGLIVYFKIETIPALVEEMIAKIESAYKVWTMGVSFHDANSRLELGFQTEGKPHLMEGYLPFNLVPASSVASMSEEEQEPGEKRIGDASSGREVIRTAMWNKTLRPISGIERAYRLKLKKHFYKLRVETLKNLERVLGEKSIQKGKTEDTAESINFNLDAAKDDIYKVSEKYIDGAFKEGAENVFAGTGVSFDFDYLDERVTDFLEDKKEGPKDADESLWDKMQSELIEGIDGGESVQQLGDRIRSVFNTTESHALTIARTETAEAFNGGRYEALVQASEQDLVQQHEWLSSRDERVRDSHADEDGSVVDIGDDFPFTGLKYPGDIDGDPVEIINCRCTVIPIIKK